MRLEQMNCRIARLRMRPHRDRGIDIFGDRMCAHLIRACDSIGVVSFAMQVLARVSRPQYPN